jgi:CheY-like chemotaxis protein
MGEMAKRVLHIEDNPDNASLVKVALETTGLYEVTSLDDPSQVLARVLEVHPDAIVIDHKMNNEYLGRAIYNQLQTCDTTSHIPCVFLTEWKDVEDLEQFASINKVPLVEYDLGSGPLRKRLAEALVEAEKIAAERTDRNEHI